MEQYRARYQGESVGLLLNPEAAAGLSQALERLRFSNDGDGYEEVPLRLPDGRTLRLSLSLTAEGELLNEYGDYAGDDGLAHGDVVGDLRDHVDADNIINAACSRPLLTTGQLDGSEPVNVEALAQQQTDAALGGLNHYPYEERPEWLASVRERALAAARERLPEYIARTKESWRRTEAQQAAERALEERVDQGAPIPGAIGPVRLRNVWDDSRREVTEHARRVARWADEEEAAGEPEEAASWRERAGYWQERAQWHREQALAEDRCVRGRDPAGYTAALQNPRATSRGTDSGLSM